MDFVLPGDDENLTYRENFERREALIKVTHGEMVTANKNLLEKFNYQHEYWITTKAFVLHKDIFKSKKVK